MILCGAIPDERDDRDFAFETSPILSGSGDLVTSDDIDLRRFCSPVGKQIASNCCGHATRESAFATAAASGGPIELPSAAFLYSVARLQAVPLQARSGPRLIDRGSSLRLMFKGMARWGLVAERRWPESPETTNAVPPDDCFREGENATIAAFYRIADGPGAAEGIRAALRRLYFPVFGMFVDVAYEQIGAKVYRAPGGLLRGGHAQVIVGYSRALDAFLVKGSWGTGFGDEGYFWIAASFMEAATWDKWVIEIAPAVIS